MAEQNETLAKMVAEMSTKMDLLFTAGQDPGPSGPALGSAPAPAPYTREPSENTGTYLVGTRNVPKFAGDQSRFPIWRRKITTCLLQAGCRKAINATNNPIRIGYGDVNEEELRAHHSASSIREASLAWKILDEAVTFPPLQNKMYSLGSPSEAWAAIET